MDKYVIVSIIVALGLFATTRANAAAPFDDHCNDIFNLVNRPSQSDSPCPVPAKRFMIETGINYLNLGRKHSLMYPNSQLRFGLPDRNEIYAFWPNYLKQNYAPSAGIAAPQIGIKHELSVSTKWVVSMEGEVTLPTGSYNFGSNGTGVSLNGIAQYNVDAKVSITMMLSLNSLTMASYQGGQRYTTIKPFLLVSFQPKDEIEFYAEVFGQSRTAANQGAGSDIDLGIIYKLQKNCEADIEIGHRLSGIPIGFNNYIGTGMSYLFD